MSFKSLTTALLLLATAPALHAASVLTFTEKVPGSQAEPKLVRRIAIDGPRLRVDASPETGGKVLLFHADSGTLYVIDEASRSYTELHRTEVPIPMEEVKVAVPARRRGKAPEDPSPAITAPDGTSFKKVDSGFIVNGFRTDKYEATKGGAKVADLFVADPKNLGLAETDLKTLRGMSETFSAGGKGIAGLDFAAQVPGLPVRIVRYEGGNPTVQIDLASLRQEEVPAALFELPQGFSRMAQGLSGGS